MSKPWVHAKSSVRRYGGAPEDYIEIHNLMDASKGAIPSNIHRALTHTSWFLSTILERVFGVVITNSDGKEVSVRSIGEQHIIEDLGFIPTPQDYFENCEYKDWMHGRGVPPSMQHIVKNKGNGVGNLNSPEIAPVRPAPSEEILTKSDKKEILNAQMDVRRPYLRD